MLPVNSFKPAEDKKMTKILLRKESILSKSFGGASEKDPYVVEEQKIGEVDKIFVNKDTGDMLFSEASPKDDWYLLPKGSDKAYELSMSGMDQNKVNSETVIIVHFGSETSKKEKVATLSYMPASGVGQIMFDDGAGNLENKKNHDAYCGGVRHKNSALLFECGDDERRELIAGLASGKITAVGLPDVREIEKAVRAPDGDYIILNTNVMARSSLGDETSRLFKGPLNDLKEIELKEVSHIRNGTIVVTTKAGDKLFIGSPYASKEHEQSTWNGTPVEKVEVADVAKEIGTKQPRVQGLNKAQGSRP
jgi:hypothetical protein